MEIPFVEKVISHFKYNEKKDDKMQISNRIEHKMMLIFQ